MSSILKCPNCLNTNVVAGTHCGNCGNYIVKVNFDNEKDLNVFNNEELLKENITKFFDNPNSDILEIYKFGYLIQIVNINLNEVLIGVSKSKPLNSEQKSQLINLNFIKDEVNHFIKIYPKSFQKIENELYNLVLVLINNVFNIDKDIVFRYNLSIISTPSENAIIPEHKKPSTDNNSLNLPFNSNYIIFGIILFVLVVIIYSINNKEQTSNKVYNFSLDSSVHQVETYLKNNLNDKNSYEPLEWSKVTKLNNKEYMVRHKYRANNAYGVKVLMNQIFFLDFEGNIIHVQDYKE